MSINDALWDVYVKHDALKMHGTLAGRDKLQLFSYVVSQDEYMVKSTHI